MRLFSNRSQMTSKCGKNKKVVHEATAECVADVVTTFWPLLWSITEQTHGNMEFIYLYNNESFLISKSFKIARKPAFAPPLPTLANTKVSHFIMYTRWSNLIGYYAQQRILIGPEKPRHCQAWLERRWASLVVEAKLTAKAELKCEIYKS